MDNIIEIHNERTLELLQLASEIVSQYKIFQLKFEAVQSSDERVSTQIMFTDMLNGKEFGLLANNKDDVNKLLPRLLQTVIELRDKKNRLGHLR